MDEEAHRAAMYPALMAFTQTAAVLLRSGEKAGLHMDFDKQILLQWADEAIAKDHRARANARNAHVQPVMADVLNSLSPKVPRFIAEAGATP